MSYIRKSDGSRKRVRKKDIWGPPKTAAELEAEARAQIPAVSRMQFAAALAIHQVITPTEAKDFAGGNGLPQFAVSAIEASGLGELEQTIAEIRALSASSVSRTNSVVLLMQQAAQLSDVQVDGIFATAQGIA